MHMGVVLPFSYSQASPKADMFPVGSSVGSEVGSEVGRALGEGEDGAGDGTCVGDGTGMPVGAGEALGAALGFGEFVGIAEIVGLEVVGLVVGATVDQSSSTTSEFLSVVEPERAVPVHEPGVVDFHFFT
mmetsp:Transcript_60665/g.166575  ORF Transcript_60665/g.166575 Transcript_60665/m.166575 type:complete len:130 (+) Transcript_60665:1280-1669(+)